VLACAVAFSGCASHKQRSAQVVPGPDSNKNFAPIQGTSANQKMIVTPESALVGKVATVNQPGKFVVLNFPIGHLPVVQQHLNVYRQGLKVGELKVTGPQLDDNIVADLVAGESEPGDEVRDK